MLKFDSMHCVNLGVDLWIAGSAMRMILDHELAGAWPGLTDADRLSVAYEDFRRFTKLHKLKSLS